MRGTPKKKKEKSRMPRVQSKSLIRDIRGVKKVYYVSITYVKIQFHMLELMKVKMISYCYTIMDSQCLLIN
jgi:hypothetical protein